jgi:hypothetical protein
MHLKAVSAEDRIANNVLWPAIMHTSQRAPTGSCSNRATACLQAFAVGSEANVGARDFAIWQQSAKIAQIASPSRHNLASCMSLVACVAEGAVNAGQPSIGGSLALVAARRGSSHVGKREHRFTMRDYCRNSLTVLNAV